MVDVAHDDDDNVTRCLIGKVRDDAARWGTLLNTG